ncbi:MAG TPA: hypothetical protein VGE02_16290 [Gemmatimonadales bacterium]
MSLPQFRPRSPTEIVDAAIQLGRRHYQSLLVLSAIIAIPNLVLGLVAQSFLPPAVSAGAELGEAGDILLAFGVSAVSIAWTVVGFGALVASTARAYVEGRPLEPLDAMRRAVRRSVRLVLGNLVAYVMVMAVVLIGFFLLAMVAGAVAVAMGTGGGGDPQALGEVVVVILSMAMLVAMVAGGLLLGSRYANITAAVMLEERGIVGAIRRSSELVRGNLWRTAGVVLIMFVLYLVAFLTSWAVFVMVVRDVNLSANVAGVLVLALYPFLGAMLTLLYYDLRIRREGYDLELMARALGPMEDAGAGGASAGGTSASGASAGDASAAGAQA